MRNLSRSPIAWSAAILLVLFAATFSSLSCRHHHNNEDLAGISVNDSFATDPPIAQDISLQKLDQPTDDGNTLLTATFRKDQFSQTYLAYYIDSSKVVLRDDGVEPDKEKGDGIFSAVIKTDLEELQRLDADQAARTKNGEAISVANFQGRIVAGTSRVPPAELSSFLKGGLIHLHFPPFPIFPTLLDSIRSNSVLINELSVVADTSRTFDPCGTTGHKMGPWTFGFLMTQLANQASTGVTPSRFVLDWLLTFTRNQQVNGDPLSARTGINNFIHTWLVRSNGLKDSTLDLSIAPFRLLAIVNRVDLRNNPGYTGSKKGNAGEGRFVFCGTDSCSSLRFTVIFEYGINKTTCSEIRAYAKEWFDLKNFAIGSSAYNAALQHITDQFTLSGTNPAKPNGSSLNQLRTNEIAFGPIWELREFNIDGGSHLLIDTTTKLTPRSIFNRQPIIDSFVNQHEFAIKKNTHTVPLSYTFNGVATPFLSGVAPEPPSFWTGDHPHAITNDTAREVFSLNTCNGCHNSETNTVFTQISQTSFGTPAPLSGFLTGVSVNDPAGNPEIWQFNDLKRRAQDLITLVHSPCFILPLHFKPLNMTH